MSSSNGRVTLVVTAIGGLVGIPILLAAMWSSWQAMQEGRHQGRQAPVVGELPAAPSAHEVVEPPPPVAPVPLSELSLEQVVADLLEVSATTDSVDDLDPTLPYKLAWTASEGLVVAATVDHGRDGTIDERWTLRPELTRELVEGATRRRMVIRDGGWVPE